MSKLRCIGLDVHKDSLVIAVADSGNAPAQILKRIPWSESRLLGELQRLGPLETLKVCYEAGPTGYGLARFLQAAGVECLVIAPSLVPKAQGERVKTDRRDARKLAHFLRSGDLTAVWIPDLHTEALRDLERARDDARLAERRLKQQLLKFLLRHGRRFTEGKHHWTKTHWQWIRRQRFDHEAQNRVLADVLTAIELAQARVARLDQDIAECLDDWALSPLVKHLQAFRGVAKLTAVALAAEVGDFLRFPKASHFMAYVGLVPIEDSTGQSRRQGGITKTGNRHLRRLLIEAAWHYDQAPVQVSAALVQRREGVPEAILTIADRAHRRLRTTSFKMRLRKKPGGKIATTLARELAGFVWSAARTSQEQFLASSRDGGRTPTVTTS